MFLLLYHKFIQRGYHFTISHQSHHDKFQVLALKDYEESKEYISKSRQRYGVQLFEESNYDEAMLYLVDNVDKNYSKFEEIASFYKQSSYLDGYIKFSEYSQLTDYLDEFYGPYSKYIGYGYLITGGGFQTDFYENNGVVYWKYINDTSPIYSTNSKDEIHYYFVDKAVPVTNMMASDSYFFNTVYVEFTTNSLGESIIRFSAKGVDDVDYLVSQSENYWSSFE